MFVWSSCFIGKSLNSYCHKIWDCCSNLKNLIILILTKCKRHKVSMQNPKIERKFITIIAVPTVIVKYAIERDNDPWVLSSEMFIHIILFIGSLEKVIIKTADSQRFTYSPTLLVLPIYAFIHICNFVYSTYKHEHLWNTQKMKIFNKSEIQFK